MLVKPLLGSQSTQSNASADSVPMLPPLNHIKAFEATLRNGSVQGAARELNISASSVSRHNRLLQERMGVELFEESSARIVATERGRILGAGIRRAFDTLEFTAKAIANPEPETNLRIRCPRSFLNRWLVPRLDRFLNKHHDTVFHASDMHEGNRANESDLDTQIRISFSRINSDSEVLCCDPILPLISPKLSEELSKPFRDNCLRLLCETEELDDCWEDWFKVLPELQSHRTSKLFLSDLDATLEAALHGHGIALSRKSIAKEFLNSRQLVTFSISNETIDSFLWFTKPSGRSMYAKESRFLSWIRAELTADS